MIIIKVQGGLGNQLLQYSIGRVIAEKFNKDVAYDLSFFEQDSKYTKRPYLLDKFTTDVRVATETEILKARYPYGVFSKVFSLVGRFLNKYFFKKYYIAYDKNFFSRVQKNDNLYLEGFWQGYRYYEDYLPLLSSEITLKDSVSLEKIAKFKQYLSFDSKVSVSVHIRRGDFLNKNAGTKVVLPEYYEQAVPLLENKIPTPTYYVFSDDINWVKEEMGHLFNDVIYVSSLSVQDETLTDYEEFILMKECRHAILSNSTFCWFATLLTNSPSKVVFYPNDWKNVFLNKDKNICPQGWQGL